MRTIFLILLLAGAGVIVWLVMARPGQKGADAKPVAIAVSKHSTPFNTAISTTIADYNRLTENLVNWDSTAAAATAGQLVMDFDKLPLDELKKDSAAIYQTAEMFVANAKSDAETIVSEKKIRSQREALNSLTDNFYQFLNTVRYDREKLYLQQCPMAFDDEKAGSWLSQQEEIRNPYLGLHHPTYGKGMLQCGETKVKMNNTGQE